MMKPLLGPAGLVCLALAACQPAPPAGLSEADRTAIRAGTGAWVETYNENDWEGLAALFTPDATMMPPKSPAVTGRADIADWEADNEAGFRIALRIEAIEGAGDLAWVRGRSCVFIPLGEDETGVDAGKYVEVRERQADGRWLIAADIFNSDLPMGAELLKACPF